MVAQTYVWRGNAAGSLDVAKSWNDLTAKSNPATIPPGTADSVSIAGPSAGVQSVFGPLSVASFAITGGVAMTGAVAAGTLTVAGTLALAPGASFTATNATLSSGALSAGGAGASFTVAGTLALAGTASATGGGAIAAGAVSLTNATLEADALSSVTIGAATAAAGTIAIAAGALVSGSGQLGGAIDDDGTIAAAGGELSLFGAVSDAGTLSIGAGATLFASGAVGADITAAFAGTGGMLELFTDQADFEANITGYAIGDAIDIASATIDAATWAAGTLTLVGGDGGTLDLALSGGAGVWVALPDGMGGSEVQLAPAASQTPKGTNATYNATGLVLMSGGAGSAGLLSVAGTVALTTTLSAGQLIQSGTFAILGRGRLNAGTASISGGVLLAQGGGALSVTTTLTLGGLVSGEAGGVISAGTLAFAGGTLALDSTSTMTVGAETADAGMLAVATSATVSGHGVVMAGLDIDGVVRAQGGALTVLGAIIGAGTLAIAGNATLAALGPVGAQVGFATGATLDLIDPVDNFTGTLSGFAIGDQLDLGGISLDSVGWSAGTLALMDAGATLGAVGIAGDYTGATWQAASDGGGGTLVTLASTPSPLMVTGTLNVTSALAAPSVEVTTGAMVAMASGTLTTATLTLDSGGTLGGNGTLAGAVVDGGAIAASGGALTLTGMVSGGGTVGIAGNATLYAPSGIGGTVTLSFTGLGGTLELLGSATALTVPVAHMDAVNVIDIAGAAVVATSLTTGGGVGTLSLTGAAGSLGSVTLLGAYRGYGAATIPDGRGGTLISLVPCFAAGTRIATPRGVVAVESLRVGDLVVTPDGPRPLTWVARRRCDSAAAPEIRPVRLKAGALGGALPRHDLILSPQHALLLRGVLVPAVALVHPDRVVRGTGGDIVYHHLGFPTQTTVLAEGLAAESYLPAHDAATFDREDGERPPPGEPWAPRLEGGPALEALRAALFGAPALPASGGRLIGHVERMVESRDVTWLEGWAFDPEAPTHPVVLPVRRDAATCGVVVANIWRPDLDRAGLAGGRCAFRACVPGPGNGLTLRRPHDAADLPIQPPS